MARVTTADVIRQFDISDWDSSASDLSVDFLLNDDAPAVSSSIRRHNAKLRQQGRQGRDMEASLVSLMSSTTLDEEEERGRGSGRNRDAALDSSSSMTSLVSTTVLVDHRQAGIDRENARLCRRIQEQLTRPPSKSFSWRAGSQPSMRRPASASAVNRSRQDDKIYRENMALLQRLQAVKPSKGVSASEHKKHFAKHMQYSQNASRRRLGQRTVVMPTKPSDGKIMAGSRSRVIVQPVWEAGW